MASNRLSLLARSFSTSVTLKSKLVASPIGVYGIEGRYAHALYSAATKQNKLDAVEKELKDFQALLKTDVKLNEFVLNPTVRKFDKKDVLVNVMKKKNYSPLTTNLFVALADNGRFKILPALFATYAKIMSAHRGEVVCTVTTAKALEAAHLKDLKTALDSFVEKGQVIQLETKVDPSIIGGMVVNIGDKYIDMSMSTKIKTYTELIKQAA
ncbi:hypothetical protein HELRODRAFT_185866 [Helobdella robusta]|uniref:ATP synthase peripheral stalk subunit OSCP, mitochondrial n=1 Tax=Helobdella robusta TaxID=6412 RepID=T1FND5_HELRO|nr:hypothetical protein HELRODRAFT_185866 [Helobdella robusta]ESN98321.1 hypothetical protein HELRODRAFT_185866 [Helobdella robusta]